MIEMKKQIARDLCPYTKFKWHEKKDMCDTCRAISGKIDDYCDSIVEGFSKEVARNLDAVVDVHDRRIGLVEFLSMLYNPRKYVKKRIEAVKSDAVIKIGSHIC